MPRSDPTLGRHDATYLIRRGRIWQFRRAVPGELAALDPRREIRCSTGTPDRGKAAVVAAKINRALKEYWRDLLVAAHDRTATAAATRFTEALSEARSHNLTYRPAAEIAEQPLADIITRVRMVDTPVAPAPRKLVAAVLGGAAKPSLRLSGLFDVYQNLVTDQTLGKSGNQLGKWQATRQRAISNLIAMVGDKPIADITRDDALNFKEWWVKRIRDDGYDQTSANKDLGALAKMMRTINDAWRLNLSLPFAGIRVADEKHRPRVAYDLDFVRLHILPGHRLEHLNPDAELDAPSVAFGVDRFGSMRHGRLSLHGWATGGSGGRRSPEGQAARLRTRSAPAWQSFCRARRPGRGRPAFDRQGRPRKCAVATDACCPKFRPTHSRDLRLHAAEDLLLSTGHLGPRSRSAVRCRGVEQPGSSSGS